MSEVKVGILSCTRLLEDDTSDSATSISDAWKELQLIWYFFSETPSNLTSTSFKSISPLQLKIHSSLYAARNAQHSDMLLHQH